MSEPGHSITGRRVSLRPVIDDDATFLLHLAQSDPGFISSLSLAHAANTAGVRSLLSAQLDHRIIEPRDGGPPIGYVSAHSRPPAGAGVVRVGTFVTERYRATGIGMEAGGLFISHLFRTLEVRRVEGVLVDDVLAHIGSGVDRLFGRDATLREAAFVRGRFYDVHVVSLSRQDWEAQIRRFAPWLAQETVGQ